MSANEKEQKYQNWIDRHLNWLCENTSKIHEVRIYCGDVLNGDSEKEILSCAGGEKAKFSILYRKVKEAGFQKIDIIIRALEESKQKQIADEFKYIQKTFNTVSSDEVDESNGDLDFASNETPLIVTVKSGSKKYAQVSSSSGIYKNVSNPRGFALIILNENYADPRMIRAGATNDLHYMLNLFKQLKYSVTVKRDIPSDDLETILSDFKSQFSTTEVDSCVVVCMGHGESNGFIMVNGTTVNIWADLVYRFDDVSCPQLKDKPKIFIFQACQNFADEKPRNSTDSTVFHSAPSDFLVAFSTIPGYASYRDSYLGSWFIYCLTETFMNHAHNTDIEELLRMTNRRMSQIRDGTNIKQVSGWLPIAFNKFYFNV